MTPQPLRLLLCVVYMCVHVEIYMEVEGHQVSFSITPCVLRQSLSLTLEHNGSLRLTEPQALQCLLLLSLQCGDYRLTLSCLPCYVCNFWDLELSFSNMPNKYLLTEPSSHPYFREY